MEKNYNEEIELLEGCNKVENKLQILVMYERLYEYLVEAKGISCSEELDSYMKETFGLVINRINNAMDIETICSEKFMKLYIDVLKMEKEDYIIISDLVLYSIETLMIPSENRNINNFYSLEEDFTLEHITHKYSKRLKDSISKLFDRDYAFILNQQLYSAIMSRYIFHEVYGSKFGVSAKQTIDTLEPALADRAYEFLINEFANNEFRVDRIMDSSLRHSLEVLTVAEQKLWLVTMIYSITGYTLTADNKEHIKR